MLYWDLFQENYVIYDLQNGSVGWIFILRIECYLNQIILIPWSCSDIIKIIIIIIIISGQLILFHYTFDVTFPGYNLMFAFFPCP
jgi:hypothetical protein